MTTFEDFKDNMAKGLYGQTTEEAKETGLCIQCKEGAIAKCYSPEGLDEYGVSGLCETCFDEIMMGE